jgi:hypothetical protein
MLPWSNLIYFKRIVLLRAAAQQAELARRRTRAA